MMEKENISKIMEILMNHFSLDRKTTLNRMRENPDPYKVLIGCIVSINIKDAVTEKILEELFKKVSSFQDMINIDIEELEKMLYLARYRRVKAARLKSISKEILEKFDGKVPENKENLLSIKGIGPKTANVVLNFAYNHPVIPIDSNTIRIVNRLGWINGKNPEKTEKMLIENLDENNLKNANAVFMLHGKNICTPVSPFCSRCPINEFCTKIGVINSR